MQIIEEEFDGAVVDDRIVKMLERRFGLHKVAKTLGDLNREQAKRLDNKQENALSRLKAQKI